MGTGGFSFLQPYNLVFGSRDQIGSVLIGFIMSPRRNASLRPTILMECVTPTMATPYLCPPYDSMSNTIARSTRTARKGRARFIMTVPTMQMFVTFVFHRYIQSYRFCDQYTNSHGHRNFWANNISQSYSIAIVMYHERTV
jgi:hypothetical protein